MKDFSTFYFMEITMEPITRNGVEIISWIPYNTAGNFGQAFLKMEIKNNGTLIETEFQLNGTTKFSKTFTLYTAT